VRGSLDFEGIAGDLMRVCKGRFVFGSMSAKVRSNWTAQHFDTGQDWYCEDHFGFERYEVGVRICIR